MQVLTAGAEPTFSMSCCSCSSPSCVRLLVWLTGLVLTNSWDTSSLLGVRRLGAGGGRKGRGAVGRANSGTALNKGKTKNFWWERNVGNLVIWLYFMNVIKCCGPYPTTKLINTEQTTRRIRFFLKIVNKTSFYAMGGSGRGRVCKFLYLCASVPGKLCRSVNSSSGTN